MTRILLIPVFMLSATGVWGQAVQAASGSIKRIENFTSRFVDSRNIDVWLPDGYSADKKYAVLYMHDGQMLFDAATTWNKQEWMVDEVAGNLQKDGKVRDFIVVGVWNNGDYRHSEYYPQKTLDFIPQDVREFIVGKQLKSKPQADSYLKFLVEELKPYIDKKFSTKKEVENTFIAGSSMGGLISIYAICEYPNVFGGAAGISTHLPLILAEEIEDKYDIVSASFRTYLRRHLPRANSRKIYFDYGDQTLDAYYPPLQKKVDELMKSEGWNEKMWTTKFFPGEDHSEKSWAKRLEEPLEFLLGENTQP